MHKNKKINLIKLNNFPHWSYPQDIELRSRNTVARQSLPTHVQLLNQWGSFFY
jgi:hypothetical protein